ncbi:VC0807 family protein [Streptomyces sp. NPDC048506]|uniref:VC0807 family protein n=1 Tax=Streptomyces sp. NPDC048506 TaxID=3155028 RepID=UPI00341F791D
MEAVGVRDGRQRRAVAVPLVVDVVLPLVLYYALRSQGAVAWLALLLSGAVPAAHALVSAVVRRRVEVFDLLVVVLLAASAALSLISGSPRVLLLKDAGIPAALGAWILSSLWAARPFAFHFGRRLRGRDGEAEAERVWRDLPDFRAALRGLTALWGGAEVLDAALSAVEAWSMPVDLVPVVGRFQSLAILGAVAVLTVRRSRTFRSRWGIPLFGVRAPAAATTADQEATERTDVISGPGR